MSAVLDASMRPGQTAPECGRCGRRGAKPAERFNEAGADCPGMRAKFLSRTTIGPSSFNEAGADCPGMPNHSVLSSSFIRLSFNEAGADCPGMLPAP